MGLPISEDAELRELFRGEVFERAGVLVEGARAFAAGDAAEGLAHDLYREGHTIKGTGRMMGFIAISSAGKLLEDTWRSVDEGDREIDPELAGLLGAVAAEFEAALDADPETGTPELAEAATALQVHIAGEAHPTGNGEHRPASDTPETLQTAGSMMESADLGGLLGAIDDWAFGENVRVNASNLFTFINAISALRVESEALSEAAAAVRVAIGDPDEFDEHLEQLTTLAMSTEKTIVQLQQDAVDLAAAPISEITNTFPQLLRYIARKSGKDIRFELIGDHHAVDRQILERLSDPLRLLLVNAVHHGIEPKSERVALGKETTGTVTLSFAVQDHRLHVEIEDDGRGIDWSKVEASARRRGLLEPDAEADNEALYALLLSEHFSTLPPGELVGDGDGLSTVSQAVESVHGTLRLETELGRGTKVSLVVPTSRALQGAVLITAAGQTWGIPAIAVLARQPFDAAAQTGPSDSWTLPWEGGTIPAIPFADAVGLVETEPPTRALVVSHPAGPVAFLVASEIGRRQVAAREVGPVLSGVPHLTGAALLGGGNIVVLVDPARLVERARLVSSGEVGPRPRVLVVDDSQGARQVVGGALGSAGFEVDLAGSADEALAIIGREQFDALVLDFVLPTMDGAALVRKVRELGVEAPIVVLSGLATEGDKARALAAGADACLDKDDVRKGALAAALRSLLARQEKTG